MMGALLGIFAMLLPVCSLAQEAWECRDLAGDWSNITVVAENDLDGGRGRIDVAGTSYTTLYHVAGFKRRWDWSSYSFMIFPDGDGAYYDFTLVEDGKTTGPSIHFVCRQAKHKKNPGADTPGH